ncbi:cyclic nucleotide-binding domain-containing protein [Methylopila musalis]|uniref:Cyclic nucleotide-binding domain-containing protein n=1 Tax=Methylopila musalis TaxID=1134781 RepID=A0ABW3ZB07_9HYPH
MALEDDIRTLSRAPVLDALGHDALRLIAFSADRQTLRDGQTLFREGQRADGGYVVMSGAIDLFRGKPEDGRGRRVEAGALIGEMALITELKRPATAVAAGAANVLRIARPLFLRLFDEYPALAETLRQRLAERVAADMADLRRIEARLRR